MSESYFAEEQNFPSPLTKVQMEELREKDRWKPDVSEGREKGVVIMPGLPFFGYLRFFNARPSAGGVDVYINGRKMAEALDYRMFTKYFRALPGYYRIGMFETGSRRSLIAEEYVKVIPGRIYTAALSGQGEDASVRIIPDRRKEVPKRKALVRFIGLSQNAPALDAYWNDSLVLEDIHYGEVSRFMETPAGTYNLKFREYISGRVLAEEPELNVKGGRAYSVYVVGDMEDRTGLQIIATEEGASYLGF